MVAPAALGNKKREAKPPVLSILIWPSAIRRQLATGKATQSHRHPGYWLTSSIMISLRGSASSSSACLAKA